MKDYRFYIEYSTPRNKRKNHNGINCIAVYTDKDAANPGHYMALSAVLAHPEPNTSALCWGEVSYEYLISNCKRVSEQQARLIHPHLFERLSD